VSVNVHATDDITAVPTRLERARMWLPRGDSLSAEAFAQRHRTLSILLGAHLPILIVFGIVRGYDTLHVLAEIGFAGLLLGIARLPATPRRLQGILVSAGFVWCSAVLVHFSGGVIEAHFHFFVILGFIALYQDWAAFGWAIVFTALSHGVGSTLAPTLMFNHDAAVQRPWTWALIHAGMVLFAAAGQIIGWRHAELSQHQATQLNTQLVREQASRQASYSRIYVNLARRNQSLLHRQLAVIDQLEEHEEDPETLRKLFALDHLTTRVRRNAESLLVMAGEDSPRRWTAPVVLADIARAAASEIEQYERADVRVADPIAVAGGVVVDLTHLLAELIENAAEYSSPTSSVLVGGYATPDGAVVTVEDHGISMSQTDLDAANQTLADPPELDEEVVRHLGFQVVGRLARKLHLRVHLRPTVGGGITAVVEIPSTLLAGDDTEDDAPIQPVDIDAPQIDVAPSPAAPIPAAPAPAASPAPAELSDQDIVAQALFEEAAADRAMQAAAPMPPTPPVPMPVAATPPPVPAPPVPVAAAPAPHPTPAPLAPAPAAVHDAASWPLLFSAKQAPSAPAATVPPEPTTVAPARPVAHVQPIAAPVVAPASGDAHGIGVTSDRPLRPDNGRGQVPGDGHVLSPVSGSPLTPESAFAQQLPRRTPAASLAPGLRDATAATPGIDPHGAGNAPEARQALSAFQSAARAARAGDDHQPQEPQR
jgi:signal transduction histidine kinase